MATLKNAEAQQIGRNIEKFRLKNNLTINELANQIGTSKEQLYLWRKGINKPRRETLERISQIFDISVDELFYGYTMTSTQMKYKEKDIYETLQKFHNNIQFLLDYNYEAWGDDKKTQKERMKRLDEYIEVFLRMEKLVDEDSN